MFEQFLNGSTLLSGDVGVGKTTFLRKLAEYSVSKELTVFVVEGVKRTLHDCGVAAYIGNGSEGAISVEQVNELLEKADVLLIDEQPSDGITKYGSIDVPDGKTLVVTTQCDYKKSDLTELGYDQVMLLKREEGINWYTFLSDNSLTVG